MVFAEVLQKERSAIRVVPLAETLSAVNKAGLDLEAHGISCRDRTVAWEETQELHFAYDSITEEPLTLPTVVSQAAQELISELP